MIVVKELEPIIGLLENQFQIPKLTLGNLGNQVKDESTTVLTRFVSVNKKTIPQLMRIAEYGTEIEAQLIPEDAAEDVIRLMKEKQLV